MEVGSEDAYSSDDSLSITDILNSLGSCQNFTNPAINWTKPTFIAALRELGIFTIKGLEVVTLTQNEIANLTQSTNHTKIEKASFPQKRNILPGQGVEKRSSRGSFDLCAEYVDSLFILAHANSQLAYKIESVRCEGLCRSKTYGIPFGTCNVAKKTMVVFSIDRSGKLAPKTIEPGCACECLHYFE